jgi:uncharacterized protein (DUF1330 family)
MPRAYIIADVTVTNPEQMAKYREWSTKAMQEHGAEVLVRGGAVEVLEGPWTPSRVVLLGFESADKARAFYASETYQHAITVRQGAGIMRMVMVEGVA